MAAAVHATRASPPRLQTLRHALVPPSHPPTHHLHPLTQSLHPSSNMDKKHYLSPSFSGNPLHPMPYNTPVLAPLDDDDFGEDIDEDDMSDLEQELLAYRSRQCQPDMTRQLLAFAEMVNVDIQKFFGRKKGDEESCDVYEDKWVATKSGRELYYADLLRMAQGDFGDSKASSLKSSHKASSRHIDVEVLEDNRHSFSGKADSSLGLGPLSDLFALGGNASDHKSSTLQHNAAKRSRTETDMSSSNGLPMHQRRFPDSFWREPGLPGLPGSSVTSNMEAPVMTSSVLQGLGSSKLPDFSDLMESWHGDHSQLQQQHLHHLQPLSLQHQRSSASDTFSSISPETSTRKRRL